MESPLVSIVVVNWNGEHVLKRCLPSLLCLDYPNYEVVVVDNNSSDRSLQFIEHEKQRTKKHFRIIKNKINYGNAKGKNIGVKHSRGKYLWLLDNDIKVKSDSLRYLVNYLEKNDDVGILSPKLLQFHNPNRILSAGGLFTFYGPSINNLGFNNLDIKEYNKIREISFATGAVVFTSKKLWEVAGEYQVRGNSFCYEDADFGARCRIFGYKIFFIPKSITFHYGESGAMHSGRDVKYYRERYISYIHDMLSSIIKNFQTKNLIIILPSFIVFSILKLLKNIINKKDIKLFLSWIKGYFNFIYNIKRIISDRRKLQKKRMLNDKIFWFSKW
jgi:hypothetical protein